MSKTKFKSLQARKDWILQSPARCKNILSGNGVAGHRAAPAQTSRNDALIGSRLDYGETFIKDGKPVQLVHWQLNKNAQDSQIRKLAQKDSHRTWSTAEVEVVKNPNSDDSSAAITAVFEQLEDNME